MISKELIEKWNAKATFLCGHRKTGTTMLLNLMDSHPELATFAPDSGFFYAYYPPYVMNNYSDEERVQRVIDVMYYNFKTDLLGLEAWDDDRNFPFERLEEVFRECMKSLEKTPKNLLSQAIYAYQLVLHEENKDFVHPDNAKKWVEKTTSTEIYASEVFEWFPEAKFVHVLRDPRDNFASLKSGWKARYQSQNDSIERLLQSMLDRGGLGMRMAKANLDAYGKEKYMVVRYEDLTQDPETHMRKIAEFMGVSFHEKMLIPTYYGLPWKGNNFDGLKFTKPSAVNVNKWKERINDHEAKVVEFYFSDMMQEWGYDPVFSSEEQAKAAMEHYKWFNFAQAYSVTGKADTYKS